METRIRNIVERAIHSSGGSGVGVVSIFGLTVRYPAVVAVLAVAQVTFPRREGLAGAAVHRASDRLKPNASALR